MPAFFELNGQPRIVKVPNRAVAASAPQRRKGDESDPEQVVAPMPGVIVALSVQLGQCVQVGDVLATIEAMKMETTIRAPLDGKVAEIFVSPGNLVEKNDLLLEVK